MSQIAFAGVVAALTVAVPLTMGRAEAQAPVSSLPPGAAPPWADTTTKTDTPSAPTPAAAATPAAVPAAQPPQTVEPGMAAPIPVNATPMQGTTTPIHAVSLRAGPNTGAPVIGTLQPGMPLRVVATANYGWMQVESPVGPGWAYGSYLAPSGAAPVAQPPAPSPEVIH